MIIFSYAMIPRVHVLQVTEMAVSELPGNPNAVWTVKTNIAGVCMSVGP